MPKRKQPKKPKIDEVVETPPPPPPPPPPLLPPVRAPRPTRFLETLREAVGRVLDLADAAADALKKALRA